MFVSDQVRVRVTCYFQTSDINLFLLCIDVWSWASSNPSSCFTSSLRTKYDKAAWRLFVAACLCVQNVHLEMFVSFGASVRRISNRQMNLWNWLTEVWLLTEWYLMLLHHTESKQPRRAPGGRVWRGFPTWGGWNPVLSAAVPCCPQQPGSTMWARDDRAG